MKFDTTTNPAYVAADYAIRLAESLGLELADDFFTNVADAADYCNERVPATVFVTKKWPRDPQP